MALIAYLSALKSGVSLLRWTAKLRALISLLVLGLINTLLSARLGGMLFSKYIYDSCKGWAIV